MVISMNLTPHGPAGLAEIEQISQRAELALEKIRGTLLSPDAVKKAPVWNASQLGHFVGMDRAKVSYHAKKGQVPEGMLPEAPAARSGPPPNCSSGRASFAARTCVLPTSPR